MPTGSLLDRLCEQRQMMRLTFAEAGNLPFVHDALDWYLVMKL